MRVLIPVSARMSQSASSNPMSRELERSEQRRTAQGSQQLKNRGAYRSSDERCEVSGTLRWETSDVAIGLAQMLAVESSALANWIYRA
jgi:hypothetical protein